MAVYPFRLSYHVGVRMQERGVTLAEIEAVLAHPEQVHRSENDEGPARVYIADGLKVITGVGPDPMVITVCRLSAAVDV